MYEAETAELIHDKLLDARKKGIQVRSSFRVSGFPKKFPGRVLMDLFGMILDYMIEITENEPDPAIYFIMEETGRKLSIYIGGTVTDAQNRELFRLFRKREGGKENLAAIQLEKLRLYSRRYWFWYHMGIVTFEGRECFVITLKF